MDKTSEANKTNKADRTDKTNRLEGDKTGSTGNASDRSTDRRNERSGYFKAVTDVQRMLYTVSQVKDSIPKVLPDGIYGPETAEAVSAFQHLRGLPETKRVDNETYRALYDEFVLAEERLSEPKRIAPFSLRLCGGMLCAGDNCDTVLILQVMLNTIRIEYDCIPEQRTDGVFDTDTEEAIRSFQRINFLEPTGRVDKKTWDRLADSYNKYVKYEM